MKKRGHWGMALRAHERERDAIGNMNASSWESREAKCRRLGIEPEPTKRKRPKGRPRQLSLLELLLD
jgi:hypothetical protein